jgi:tetratricopeptide (TPR) repeat protein
MKRALDAACAPTNCASAPALRRMKRAALCILVAGFGCAHSLRTPPPMEKLAQAPTASADELLQRADAAWAHRADPGQAAQSEDLSLQAARARPQDPRGYAGAIRAKAFRLGREKDSAARQQLAESAVAVGQQCEANAPKAPACDYWLAAALGLQARERSATAHDALPHMVELLRRAEAADASLDRGGPARLLAILLLRAPGWPLGPGDPEGALAEAKNAVKAAPDYAPNQLALGEALRKNGQDAEANQAYAEALRLAEGSSDDPDAPGWVRDARAALH